jgi:glycosyltransferase involved in cell wall biosynthesis
LAALRRLGLAEKCRLVGTYTSLEGRSRFMREIDVFVHPSFTEGTPNVVIEAMAHGLPIVATSVGGVPDFVTEEIGVLVPPGDKEALGEALKRLAGDAALRRRMGTAAREKYRRLFTSGAVLPLLTEFYRRAIDAHAGARNGYAARRPDALLHPWAEGAEVVPVEDDFAAAHGGD